MTELKEKAKKVALRLSKEGYLAFFIGGCVRDSLVGNSSPKDYDIATNATPLEVQELFPNSDLVGAHFGVVIVKEGGENFEVATFRKDSSYSDSRRPDSVEFSYSPKEDAKRRDFTVNGLFECPLTGDIRDYFGGEPDAANKIIRCIGDPNERFGEDALRLLRAVRFATVLDFNIEENTWNAIYKNRNLIKNISSERIKDELVKILNSENRGRGLEILCESGLAKAIFPECEALKRWASLVGAIEEEDFSLEVGLSLLAFAWERRLVSKTQQTLDALKELRFESNTINRVSRSLDYFRKIRIFNTLKDDDIRLFLARETYETEKTLFKLLFFELEDEINLLEKKEKKFGVNLPDPFINGNDLIKLGYVACPLLGDALDRAFRAQLKGEVNNKDEALKEALKTYEKPI